MTAPTTPATSPVISPETRSPDPHIHWTCATAGSPPLISLCGELMNRRLGSLWRGHRAISCEQCRTRAPEHVAVCTPCRRSQDKWGGL